MNSMLTAWTDLYSSSTILRSVILFCHIAGLLLGGGCAVAADLVTLLRMADGYEDPIRSFAPLAAHRFVLVGLTTTSLSGVLLLLANLHTYVASLVFWTKMALVGALVLNGHFLMVDARRGLTGGAGDRARLRRAAAVSLVLWFAIALLGATMPNL